MNAKPKYQTAFTIVELLAIIGVLAVLSLTLLPALCRSASQTKVTACTANFRQWAVSANLYAKDNRDWLPRFDLNGGSGYYMWDLGPAGCNNLVPYSLPVPFWFCPVRAAEFDAANDWAMSNLGHGLQTAVDLTLYFNRSYASELEINHNYWVPRATSYSPWPATGPTLFPPDYVLPAGLLPAYLRGTDPLLYGWPKKINDRASAHVPFISDKCGSGRGLGFPNNWPNISTNVQDICNNTAHFFGGRLQGVNAAFVDGHVEARTPAKMKAVYANNILSYWFY